MSEVETKTDNDTLADNKVGEIEQIELPPKPQVAILPVEWIGEDGKMNMIY